MRETWGENTLIPLYDNEDSVCGIEYNGTAYFFRKNLQGDVIAIANASGTTVATYSYDAWGVPTILSDSTGIIASVNPFRYRSYYYDSEIAMYYLQSRYYDPSVGRFVNADEANMVQTVDHFLSANLIAYCSNNPVTDMDVSGKLSLATFAKALSYLFDAFVKIAQTVGSMSREMQDVIKSLKRAKRNGADKEWINMLKRKKKSLVSPKALGLGKINAIAKLLGVFAAILPYLSYVKKISGGIAALANLLVDTIVEIISRASKFLIDLVCKFIPYIGFLISWALGYVIDIIVARVFNDTRLNRIKQDYARRVKGASSIKSWLTNMGKSMQLAF